MFSVSATTPSPGNAASPCTSTGTTASASSSLVRRSPAVTRCRARATPVSTGFTTSRWLGFGTSCTPTVRPSASVALRASAKVVLHVARLALGGRGGVLAVELAEHGRVRLAEDVREDVDASAMRHADHDLARARAARTPR